MATPGTGSIPTDEQIRACESIAELKEIYDQLKRIPKKKWAARGHLVEVLFAQLLKLTPEWKKVRLNLKPKGEELDVVGDYRGHKYLIELKWKRSKAGTALLKAFGSTVRHMPGVRGIVMSREGFTSGAREWACHSLRGDTWVIFLAQDDIEAILDEKVPFNFLLDCRVDNAQIYRTPDEPAIDDLVEMYRKSQELPPIPDEYQTLLRSETAKMDLLKLSLGDALPVGLPEVYIPLFTDDFTQERIPRGEGCEYPYDERGKVIAEEREHREPIDVELLAAREPYLLLDGLPGSGKTTMLRHLARSIIEGEAPEGFDGFLPVLVFLKDLNEFLNTRKPLVPGVELFKETLCAYLESKGLPLEVVDGYCSAGRALLLIDGLDELREEHRSAFVQSLHRFHQSSNRVRIVLTSRPHAIPSATPSFGDRHRTIHLLNRDQKEDFIHRWFAHLAGVRSSATEERAGELIGMLRDIEKIDELVDTPLMLTAVCILYMDDLEIPDQRADLYDRVVNNLLEKRFRDFKYQERTISDMPSQVHELLGRLAHRMMEENTRSVTIDKIVGTAREMDKGVYKKTSEELPSEYEIRLAALFRERIEPDCGLMSCDDTGYTFRHFTYQEFLAATRILREARDPWRAIKPCTGNPWWQECVLLAVGRLSTGPMPQPGAGRVIFTWTACEPGSSSSIRQS